MIDEQVARLHLSKVDAKLTTLTQADYICVDVKGPLKKEHYGY